MTNVAYITYDYLEICRISLKLNKIYVNYFAALTHVLQFYKIFRLI